MPSSSTNGQLFESLRCDPGIAGRYDLGYKPAAMRILRPFFYGHI